MLDLPMYVGLTDVCSDFDLFRLICFWIAKVRSAFSKAVFLKYRPAEEGTGKRFCNDAEQALRRLRLRPYR